MTSISKPLNYVKCFIKKILPTLQKWLSMIDVVLNQKKNQNT